MNIELEYMATRSKAAFAEACAKHPKFADVVTLQPPEISASYMAQLQMLNEHSDTKVAQYLVDEELAEVIDAYAQGNLAAAIEEIHHTVAVLWRLALMIEAEMEVE